MQEYTFCKKFCFFIEARYAILRQPVHLESCLHCCLVYHNPLM